jgi:hypothetical protein
MAISVCLYVLFVICLQLRLKLGMCIRRRNRDDKGGGIGKIQIIKVIKILEEQKCNANNIRVEMSMLY